MNNEVTLPIQTIGLNPPAASYSRCYQYGQCLQAGQLSLYVERRHTLTRLEEKLVAIAKEVRRSVRSAGWSRRETASDRAVLDQTQSSWWTPEAGDGRHGYSGPRKPDA